LNVRVVRLTSDEVFDIIKSDRTWELCTLRQLAINGDDGIATLGEDFRWHWIRGGVKAVIDYARKNPERTVRLALDQGSKWYGKCKAKNLRIKVWE